MRLTHSLPILLLTAFSLPLAAVPPAFAQDQTLMPDQSAAKAKQIIQQGVQALGGDAYLHVRDETCEARVGQFDHGGNLNGYGTEIEYVIPPDKERDENIPKRNIIEVFNGDKAWTLDRGGVSDAPQTDVSDFQQNTRVDLDNLLRNRIHEPGMAFSYDGPDIVDLKLVDWVTLTDSENRSIRIAFDQSTHLPVREIVETSDPKTHFKAEEKYYFSNYHPIAGVQTPFNVERERNGIKVQQVFLVKPCEYNTGIAPSLFTRDSLEKRWDQLGGNKKKKKKD